MTESSENTVVESTEFDVDQAISNIEETGSVDGAESSAAAKVEPTPETPPAAQAPSEFEFTAMGRQIKVPVGDERIRQWASQGYSYAQQMQAFNQERERFAAQQKQYEAIKSKYGPVDEYYAKNPDKWQKVLESFQAEQNGGIDANHPIAQKLSALEEQLSKAATFIDQAQSREIEAKRTQEDQSLDNEIQSIREQYSNLDWNTPDPVTGKSLELQVLEYASKEGIKKFTTAFRDFNHDKLVKYEADRAKENVIKNRQMASKSGIIGQSQSPTKGITQAKNIKQMSYDDIEREALRELGIA